MKCNTETSQLSQLYTIWRYDHNPDTITDHKEKLEHHPGRVKWLILCNRDDRSVFDKSLPKRDLERISKQAKRKDAETVLYIQCLELFREQPYAGLIRDIQVAADGRVDLADELLPDYYRTLLEDPARNLEVVCAIELTKLEPIDAEEAYNLIERKTGLARKDTYNITKLVSQNDIHPLFDKKSPKVKELKVSRLRKARCRAIAELIWKNNPSITIADIIVRDEITAIGCEGRIYGEKILRDWIKDLCPDRSPGRRPR